MLARLVRFYHLDPERVLTLPAYLLVLLLRYLPPLDASEQLAAVGAAMAPHIEDYDRGAMVHRLSALVETMLPAPEHEPVAVIRHDPAAAAQWFAKQGTKVSKSDGDASERNGSQ